MLMGPYPINDVNSYVLQTAPGVYILSRDSRTAAYVGRSDTDLGLRIPQSASQGRYDSFWFEYASSPRDAYLKECAYYHEYNPLDNLNHPAVPAGANWRCPVSGCLLG